MFSFKFRIHPALTNASGARLRKPPTFCKSLGALYCPLPHITQPKFAKLTNLNFWQIRIRISICWHVVTPVLPILWTSTCSGRGANILNLKYPRYSADASFGLPRPDYPPSISWAGSRHGCCLNSREEGIPIATPGNLGYHQLQTTMCASAVE